jgi:hypothetical protein
VRQRAFLAAYAKTGNVTAAAKASGQRRKIHYEWMEEPEYPALFEAAREEAIDALEDAARKRALHGSDLLLIFLLKAHRPGLYRERHQVEHSGTVTVAQVIASMRTNGAAVR